MERRPALGAASQQVETGASVGEYGVADILGLVDDAVRDAPDTGAKPLSEAEMLELLGD